MRLYEVVYILNPTLDEDAIAGKLEKFHDLAISDGGEIAAVDHWGPRQLAYPVAGETTGFYVVAQFTAAPEALPEFERLLKLDDEVMRYLLVLNEGEPTSGLSIMAESFGDDEEEEDEDEEPEDEDEDDDGSPPEFQGSRGRRRRMEGPAVELLNYKDVATLSKFLTEEGKILPKRTTKVPAAFQRQLGSAVKRARFLALVPYSRGHEQ